ncbi:lecithin retinol acyltransferase family protein [Cupriavidus pauculus]|uniref:lecithin retinol acyltransferase family protein n=1 Tax=Cupriavidus pauculus TaxID=82633 RepID=UPI000782366A|nr:lecithin retinol acyltransferase family protein [Cupriavidus pauculus]
MTDKPKVSLKDMATVYELKGGDHIYVRRFGYSHHGLYLGDGQVIQYSGHSADDLMGKIEVVPMHVFVGDTGGEVKVRVYEKRRFGRPASIARALGRLGEKLYNVILNNCEHFVTWCITGWHSSRQVNRAAKLVYDVYRLSRVTLNTLLTHSWTLSDLLDPGSLMYRLAKRVAAAVAKRATKAIASPNARMATRILTEGINASMKIAGATIMPVGFAIVIAAHTTLELMSAATGIRVQSLPRAIIGVVRGIVTKVCATAKGVFRKAVDMVKSIGKRIWDGVGTRIGGIFRWAQDVLWW